MKRIRRAPGEQTVVTCYSLLDKFFPTCGLLDHSEGIYHDDPNTPYEVAQQNQIGYLLDEVKCVARRRGFSTSAAATARSWRRFVAAAPWASA